MPYETMMYAGIASTVVFLTVSGVIFIQLDIPSVIGHLTGSTQKKAIHEMAADAASGRSGSLIFGGKNKSSVPGKTADIEEGRKAGAEGRGKRNSIFGGRRREAFYMQKEMESSQGPARVTVPGAAGPAQDSGNREGTELLAQGADSAVPVYGSLPQDGTALLEGNAAPSAEMHGHRTPPDDTELLGQGADSNATVMLSRSASVNEAERPGLEADSSAVMRSRTENAGAVSQRAAQWEAGRIGTDRSSNSETVRIQREEAQPPGGQTGAQAEGTFSTDGGYQILEHVVLIHTNEKI